MKLSSASRRAMSYMRIQATILVHDEHGRQLALGLDRLRQVAAQLAVALGRRDFHVTRLDPRIVIRYLTRLGKAWTQRRQQRLAGDSDGGELGRPLQKVAPRQQTVHVLIEQLQGLRMKILGSLASHRRLLFVSSGMQCCRRITQWRLHHQPADPVTGKCTAAAVS